MPRPLHISSEYAVSYEETAKELEHQISSVAGTVCECCALATAEQKCKTCRHAVSFHRCVHNPYRWVWCKGTPGA